MKKLIKNVFFLFLFFLAAYSVQIKKKKINKKNCKTIRSFYSEWKKKGKPVFVKKAEPLIFDHKIKMTVSCFNENLFYAFVSKDLFERLKENHPVFYRCNDKEIKGTIQKLHHSLHPEKGLYKVEGIFSSGSVADNRCIVDVPCFFDEKVFYLPQGVVHEKENQHFVRLVQNHRCVEKKIVVTEEKRGYLIVEGLSENDLIAVRGNAHLCSGDLVRILNEGEKND